MYQKSEWQQTATGRKEDYMALSKARVKEILSEAGAEAEKIAEAVDKIIAGHAATVEALKEERDSYKTEAEKVPGIQKELDDLKKAAKDGKDYQTLKKEFDDYKDKVEKEKVRGAKEEAFKQVLKDAGIADRHYSKIIKYSDVDGLELDEDGKLKNAKDLLKSIKEEWSDHVDTTSTSGAKTPTPPANNGSKTTMTREEIRKISDPIARQKAMAENPSLFGLPES